MGVIGSVAIKVGADANNFDKTMDGVKRKLNDVSAMASKVSSFLTSIPALGAIGGLATFAGFSSAVKDVATASVETYKESQRLGISMKDLTAYQLLAGDSSEALSKGLRFLSRELGAAKLGDEGAMKRFTNFGLDPKKLGAMSLDNVVGNISAKMQEMADPTQRSALAFQTMGKGGQELIPFLMLSKEVFAKAGDKAVAKGLVPKEEEIAQFRQLLKDMKEFDHTIEGLKRKTVSNIGLPFMKSFQHLFEGGHGFLGNIKDVGDAWVQRTMGGQHVSIGAYLDYKRTGTTPHNQAVVDAKLEQSQEETKRAQGVSDVINKLREEEQQIGKTERQIKLMTLAEKNATPAEMAMADAILKSIEAGKEKIKVDTEIKGLYDASQTPLEKMNDAILRANDLLGRDLISWELYRRVVGNAVDAVVKFDSLHKETALPQFLEAGTVAGVSAVNKQLFGGEKLDKVGPTLDDIRKAVRDQQMGDNRRERLLDDIAKVLKPNTTPQKKIP